MIVLDGSGSMSGMGFDRRRDARIVEARAALGEVLPGIERVRRLGLVTYGPGEGRVCERVDLVFRPAPNAAGPILERVDALWPAGATPLTRAVRTAAAALDGAGGTVVLVTDGKETCGGNPCALADRLALMRPGLTVHVIGFRVTGGRLSRGDEVDRDYGRAVADARCLADRTGGQYIDAQDAEALIAALRETLGCLAIGDATWLPEHVFAR